jgi:hypothetical protein
VVTADAPPDASLPDPLDSLGSASPPDALDPAVLRLRVSRLTPAPDAPRLSAFATSAGSCPEAS